MAIPTQPLLIDRFNRAVNYLRLSVTDRCDFRCVYCMAEDMTFVPRSEILSLEELEQVARAFTELGVTKIRLTGGEPLVRHNILSLIEKLGQLEGLKDLALTTNGSQLQQYSRQLHDYGIQRVNISLDSLRAERFKQITRSGDLHQVLKGIDTAIATGFKKVKLNAVILKGRNEDEILDLVDFARHKKVDIAFIEEMPLGLIDANDRALRFCPSDEIHTLITARYPLISDGETTGGPARYYRMADSASLIGFISPHSHNFCHLCNRVRVTVEGMLLLCLGNEHAVDLRKILRQYPGEVEPLKQAIIDAMAIKPERHYFDVNEQPQIVRFMNMTGG
jgi:cyclic pyranopterin phosphate synthase